jgi:hypothetical protein
VEAQHLAILLELLVLVLLAVVAVVVREILELAGLELLIKDTQVLQVRLETAVAVAEVLVP